MKDSENRQKFIVAKEADCRLISCLDECSIHVPNLTLL